MERRINLQNQSQRSSNQLIFEEQLDRSRRYYPNSRLAHMDYTSHGARHRVNYVPLNVREIDSDDTDREGPRRGVNPRHLEQRRYAETPRSCRHRSFLHQSSSRQLPDTVHPRLDASIVI